MSKLFVSGFPENYSDENLHLIFSPFGEIKSMKIMREARVFAIVEFSRVEESKAAMDSLRGRRLYGHDEPLNVEIAFDRKKRVVVSGICSSKENLTAFFRYYGSIEGVSSTDGVVLVDFTFQRDAERFLELDGKVVFDENPLNIKSFTKKEQKDRTVSPEKCIFIYNLSSSTTGTDLIESFMRFGEIHSSGVLNGGKGFINYTKEISALKAMRHMDGKSINGKKIRIILKSMKRNLR